MTDSVPIYAAGPNAIPTPVGEGSQGRKTHLVETAATVAPGAHAGLLVDQAGWHLPTGLVVPPNITIMALPLCGVEQAHQSALANHVCRIAPLGAPVLINGTRY